MKIIRLLVVGLLLLAVFGFISRPKQGDLKSMFEECIPTTVAISYTIVYEIERESRTVYGIVLNKDGIIVAQNVVADSVPNAWVQSIKIYPLGEISEGYEAKYLGRDLITRYHYFKVSEHALAHLKAINDYKTAEINVGDTIWGLAVLKLSDDCYKPVLQANAAVAIKESLPSVYAITNSSVASVGSPVFDYKGDFVGVGTPGLDTSYLLTIDNKHYQSSLQRQSTTEALLVADEFYKYVYKNPEEKLTRPRAWLGLVGIESLPLEALKMLNLKDHGAMVISAVISDSPADKAGLKEGDIITSVDGQLLKRYPDPTSLTRSFILDLSQKNVNDTLSLEILREDQSMPIKVTLEKEPKRDYQCEREYYPRIGFSIKEFSYEDAVNNQMYDLNFSGVIASFVREHGPAADANLENRDWIKEIDGEPIDSYNKAQKILSQIEENRKIAGVVLLVERKHETKLLRVKLN